MIAGHHRLEAVRSLKWESVPCQIVNGIDALDAEIAEIDENLMRAELTPAEQALHHQARKAAYLKKYPETRRGGDRGNQHTGGKVASGKFCHLPHEQSENKPTPSYVIDTAAKTGKSQRAIRLNNTRGDDLKELLPNIIGTSLDKGEELDALRKLPNDIRNQIVEQAVEGEDVSAKIALKRIERQNREQELAGKILTLPDQKFGVIVEDLEWDFQVWSRDTGMDRHAANHYPVAEKAHSAEELHEHTKERFSIAADDCVLFMWTTVPLLKIALELMELRGFKYVSNYVWVKDRIGTGYWNRNKHEHLLIGTKGKIVAPAAGTQWDSVVNSPIGIHSAKPERFLEMIEEYYPNIPKIELNRRGVSRPGWHAWGLEASNEE